MKETLIQLSKGVRAGPAADLVPVLFGERLPTVSKKEIKFTPINSNLDHSQVSKKYHPQYSFKTHLFTLFLIYASLYGLLPLHVSKLLEPIFHMVMP